MESQSIIQPNKNRYLTREEVLAIPAKDLPLAVLSRNLFSHLATEIAKNQHGVYNHFMWMVHPGRFATQDWIFREVPAENYLQGEHLLKFWHSPNCPTTEKKELIEKVEKELGRHWFFRRYDGLQIIGFLLHTRKLQVPWLKICSDLADLIAIADPKFPAGKHFSPPELNEWFKGQAGYEVYGRFVVD